MLSIVSDSAGHKPSPSPSDGESLRQGAQVSLLAVADRLRAIAQALEQVPGVPAALLDELHCAAQRCWAVFYRQKVTLESFDFQLLQLGQLRDQLGCECLADDDCL